MYSLLFLLVGLGGLFLGSGYLVDGAKRIASMMKVSQTLIGLTIISIGTSIPEIMTNFFSGLKIRFGTEASGIALGTNVGSDITQITFILGLTSLLGVILATKKILHRDGLMVLFGILLLFLFGLSDGTITALEGTIMLILYLLYLYHIGSDEDVLKKAKEELNSIGDEGKIKDYVSNGVLILFGFGILFLATDIVVESAITLADQWGVAQSFIGVLIVGVGTGLPELSTSIRAVLKKAGDISLGTIIGSNITNPMFALPVGAIAAGSSGILVDHGILRFDIPYLFIATIIALAFLHSGMRMGKQNKKEGYFLIGIYILFVFLKIRYFM